MTLPFDFNLLNEIYDLKIKGVIHIGAHFGEEYPDYVDYGINDFVFVEPQPFQFEVLKLFAKKDPNLLIFNVALGSERKAETLFVDTSKNGASSSILKPKLHLELYPDILFKEKLRVPMFLLDDLRFVREKYNFLVMDVQGYELEVLKGGSQTLQHIDYIITEVNRTELYENCCHIDEIDSFLDLHDFVRLETEWHGGDWGDAFYLKRKRKRNK